jgi:hypothetical protein
MKVINLILCGINGDMEMLWKVKNRIVYIIWYIFINSVIKWSFIDDPSTEVKYHSKV